MRVHIGDTFGRWTVIALAEGQGNWLCKCTCNAIRPINGRYLGKAIRIHCKSCDATLYASAGYAKFASIMPRKLYKQLRSIVGAVLQRCGVQPNYMLVQVYKPWVENPELFLQYLLSLEGWQLVGNTAHALTLDRINNNGHYAPGNLRFASRSVQNSNKRKRFSDATELISGGFVKSVRKLVKAGCSIAEIANLYCESLSSIKHVLRSKA